MYKQLKDKSLFVAAVAVASIVGGASTAAVMAAIPSTSDGQIHACYRGSASLTDPKGALRVIDDQAGQTCATGETGLNWTQAGGAKVGEYLSNDFTNARLVNADLSYKNFADAIFNGASISGANFVGGDFHGADFSNVDIGSIGDGSKLDNTDFEGVKVDGATISPSSVLLIQHANFKSINYSNATLTGNFEFHYSDLSGSNFSGKSIANGAIYFSTLKNANFSNAHLTDFNLNGTDTSGTNFNGTVWTRTYCPDATYSDDNGNTCSGHMTPSSHE